MKTEKTIKKKTPTATAKAAPVEAEANDLQAAPKRKSTVKAVTPEVPTLTMKTVPELNRSITTGTTEAATAQRITTQPMPATSRDITAEQIAQRAYLLWEQQGRPHGRDVANWLLAESQLKQEVSLAA